MSALEGFMIIAYAIVAMKPPIDIALMTEIKIAAINLFIHDHTFCLSQGKERYTCEVVNEL